tara:strand:- start:1624 stop:1926 length:303 start_codon:yes stop_codon:yes gene_type:complete
MAKRKTAKAEKIVDLKPKAEKITAEELEKVQNIVNAMNRGQLDLGILETRKHQLLHSIMSVQDQLTMMQAEFEKEYGTFDINVQDGTINYKEDVKADKKD